MRRAFVMAVVGAGVDAASHNKPLSLQQSESVAAATAYTGPKVFNFGLPRTGTTAFAACMSELGLRSVHANMDDSIEQWFPGPFDALASSRPSVLDTVLDSNDAFGDLPFFSPELVQPLLSRFSNGSIVVATTRPRDDWIQSFRTNVVSLVARSGFASDAVCRSNCFAYFQHAFGKDVFNDESHTTCCKGDYSALEARLGQIFDDHYSTLQQAAARNGATLHVLDLADAESLPATISELLGSTRTCAAYAPENLAVLESSRSYSEIGALMTQLTEAAAAAASNEG